MKTEERFWAKVNKDGPTMSHMDTPCWVWTAGMHATGYGIFDVLTPRCKRAHRYSYMLHNGPIPEGMYVCHHCDNRGCVNPAHLFLGTAADNNADRDAKGRNAMSRLRQERGAQFFCNTPKLTPDLVLEIRSHLTNGLSHRKIARMYGVGKSTISRIGTRESWSFL